MSSDEERKWLLPCPGHFAGGRQPGWVLHTSGTRSLGHQQDLTLLLAGSLLQVALVLVGVTIGAAHGHVVIVTLMEGTQSSSVSHTGRGNRTHLGAPHALPSGQEQQPCSELSQCTSFSHPASAPAELCPVSSTTARQVLPLLLHI